MDWSESAYTTALFAMGMKSGGPPSSGHDFVALPRTGTLKMILFPAASVAVVLIPSVTFASVMSVSLQTWMERRMHHPEPGAVKIAAALVVRSVGPPGVGVSDRKSVV